MRFFFSYSRSVKQDVGQVIDLLRAAGHEVWWDGDIPEIADWWATILDEIERCQVFVFVVSEKSVQSAYCLEELRYATDRNRPILPFVIDDHSQYSIPPEVTPMRNQWFLYDGDPARTLRRIIDACGKINFQRYSDTPKARPLEPNKGTGSLIKEFQQAVSLAEDGHFTEAIKRFRNVMSLDFNEWGADCQRWIGQLQSYEEIAELADHKSTQTRARNKWSDYRKKYDTGFDPLDVKGRLFNSPPASGQTVVISTPPQPLAPTVGAQRVTPLREAAQAVIDIIGEPFEWVKIPAGKVTLIPDTTDTDKEKDYILQKTIFDVPSFSIAKYPVTISQFSQFIDADGYQQKSWWTEAGWRARQKEEWTEPRNWLSTKSNYSQDCPVVYISWYEAVAYCRWLSETCGKEIMLPTEQQWQRAAQGDDGRIYPWGNDWDSNRCNSNSSSKGLTHVQKYEGIGDSPFGVVDMVGNVWEWSRTSHRTGSHELEGTHVRIQRGGSWYSDVNGQFRVDFRTWDVPFNRRAGLRISYS